MEGKVYDLLQLGDSGRRPRASVGKEKTGGSEGIVARGVREVRKSGGSWNGADVFKRKRRRRRERDLDERVASVE